MNVNYYVIREQEGSDRMGCMKYELGELTSVNSFQVTKKKV